MIGYHFFSSDSIKWRYSQHGLFPLSPLSIQSKPSSFDARKLLKETGAWYIRWESDFNRAGVCVWWHVIKDVFHELGDLPKKTRYMIRKASRKYEARPVHRDEILRAGYGVYQSAYRRYKTHEPMFSSSDFYRAVKNLPEETEFWGVYKKGSDVLLGFSENYVENKTCFYVTMWLDPKSMSDFSGYLLFHEMELHYLKERKFRYVSDGARSLSHHTNIHDFLIKKFGFRKVYANLHVEYAPWLRIIVKLIYPFRSVIERVPLYIFKTASILLKQEELRRRCAEV